MEITIEALKEEFSFLTDEEIMECITFKNKYNHLPMFFILNKYMKSCEDIRVRMYSLYYGLITGTPLSYNEIFNYYGGKYGRIDAFVNILRQGRGRFLKVYNIVEHNEWKQYESFFSREYVFELSPEWLVIKETELPDISYYSFLWLASLTMKFKVERQDDIFYLHKKEKRLVWKPIS